MAIYLSPYLAHQLLQIFLQPQGRGMARAAAPRQCSPRRCLSQHVPLQPVDKLNLLCTVRGRERERASETQSENERRVRGSTVRYGFFSSSTLCGCGYVSPLPYTLLATHCSSGSSCCWHAAFGFKACNFMLLILRLINFVALCRTITQLGE